MLKSVFRKLNHSLILLLLLAATAWAQSAALATSAREVEIFGQKIHYLEAGAGPVVILLHGLGGDSTNWALTLPALSANYRVIAPDQIGFGKSDKPFINYRVATLVEFLSVFYKKLGIEKATLVGNSLGGWTAAAFTLAYPERVEKLVLVDAAGYSPKRLGVPALGAEFYSILNPATTADLRRTFKLVFYNQAMFTDQVIEQQFTTKLKRGDGQTINAFIDSIMRGEDYLDESAVKIKTPTLIIWGREDGLTPLVMGETFARDIPGAQKLIIEKCGHIPQLEKPLEFNTALLKFLKN